MEKNKSCKKCEGKGYYATGNGQDDFDIVWCSCEEGKKSEFESAWGMGKFKKLVVNFL